MPLPVRRSLPRTIHDICDSAYLQRTAECRPHTHGPLSRDSAYSHRFQLSALCCYIPHWFPNHKPDHIAETEDSRKLCWMAYALSQAAPSDTQNTESGDSDPTNCAMWPPASLRHLPAGSMALEYTCRQIPGLHLPAERKWAHPDHDHHTGYRPDWSVLLPLHIVLPHHPCPDMAEAEVSYPSLCKVVSDSSDIYHRLEWFPIGRAIHHLFLQNNANNRPPDTVLWYLN